MIKLSQKLSRAVSEAALDCPSGELKLETDDVDVLGRILLGKEKAEIPVNRKRALNAFTQTAKPAACVEVLTKLLLDAGEALDTRLAAAAGLGRFAGADSEAALIRALGAAEGHLQMAVIKALGRVGTEKGLAALDKLPAPSRDGLRRLLALSRTLIAFRTGKDGGVGEKAREDLGVVWSRQPARQLKKVALKQHIDALHGETFGLELSGDLGFEFDCGKVVMAVLFNAEFDAENPLEGLRRGVQVSAIVAQRNPRELRSTVRLLVLVTAAENGFDILVTRTSGEVVYIGEATPEGDVLRLTVRDVGGPALPASITGTVSAKGIEFDVATLERRLARGGQEIAVAVP